MCERTNQIERTAFDLFPFAVINGRQFEFDPTRRGVVLSLGQVELSRSDEIQTRLT